MTILNLSNNKYKVIKVSGEGITRRRLLEMGFVPGTVYTILRVAPFGDPVEIELRGYLISLRKEDMKLIESERINQ